MDAQFAKKNGRISVKNILLKINFQDENRLDANFFYLYYDNLSWMPYFSVI